MRGRGKAAAIASGSPSGAVMAECGGAVHRNSRSCGARAGRNPTALAQNDPSWAIRRRRILPAARYTGRVAKGNRLGGFWIMMRPPHVAVARQKLPGMDSPMAIAAEAATGPATLFVAVIYRWLSMTSVSSYSTARFAAMTLAEIQALKQCDITSLANTQIALSRRPTCRN